MADETSSGVTITLKGGQGYDAPWIVIHAATVPEAGAVLDELRQLEVFPVVREAAAEFAARTPTMSQAVQDIQNAMPGSQVYQPGVIPSNGGQQLPQQYQPGGDVKYCNHGPMTYFPNGKFGPFWACPLPKNAPDKCKIVSAR